MADTPDFEHVLIDGTTSKVHADPLRAIIVHDLTGKPPIDWRLCKQRHQIECVFNTLKRFRRIALRCEKAISHAP